MVFAICLSKAIDTKHRITLLIALSTRTLISSTVAFFAMTASFSYRTFLITEALGYTKITFTTATTLTATIYNSFT